MAQRFGGKYSPDGNGPDPQGDAPRSSYRNANVDPVGPRSNVLFIPGALLVFLSLGDGAIGLTLGLVAAALLTLAAWLLRDGLRAEAAFHARKIARRPALPRKMLATVLTGAGVGVAAYKNEPGLLAPILLGGAAMALHVTAFGIDPLKNKGMEGVDQFQSDRVARVVDQAEEHMRGMMEAVRRAGDRQVEGRVERFQAEVREMLRTVENDPRDLTGARKYLGVYLMGAKDAAIKFADIYARSCDRQARSDFMMLLTDLEENFNAKTRQLMIEDRGDLNVEIEVLRDRLQREGVRPENLE